MDPRRQQRATLTLSLAGSEGAWHTSGVEPLGKFHHVALTVSALGRSAEWYERVLGMVEAFREESSSRRAVVYRFANRGMSIGLVEHVGSNEQNFDPTVNGLDHLAFSVASEQDMQEWAAHLDLQGVEHSGPIAIPPGQILNFKDPDGIALSLFWDKEI
jgi:glyoxylase I family protein